MNQMVTSRQGTPKVAPKSTAKASLSERIRIYEKLKEPDVLKVIDHEYVEYMPGWNDLTVAKFIGPKVSTQMVEAVRREMFGRIRAPAKVQTDPAPSEEAVKLRAEVDQLKACWNAQGMVLERIGARLTELEKHVPTLGRYRDADLIRRMEAVEVENNKLRTEIAAVKLKQKFS